MSFWRSFDAQMLACHAASCTNLVCFFTRIVSAYHSLAFEAALLAVKASLEISLNALTKDLVVHHVGIALAIYATLRFPSQTTSVLFVNVIHIPLAVQYTRRMSGGARGGGLDLWFGAMWLFVVAARGGVMLTQCVRTHFDGDPVRFCFYPSAAALIALDVQWTRETFAKRETPSAAPLLLALGAVCGACFEHGVARAVWAAASAASLLLVVAAALSGRIALGSSSDGAGGGGGSSPSDGVATTD